MDTKYKRDDLVLYSGPVGYKAGTVVGSTIVDGKELVNVLFRAEKTVVPVGYLTPITDDQYEALW